jgi:hypothetical protein
LILPRQGGGEHGGVSSGGFGDPPYENLP